MTGSELNESRQKIVVKDAVYTEYDLSDVEKKDLGRFLYSDGHLDAHCVVYNSPSVFIVVQAINSDKWESVANRGILSLEARCPRHDKYEIFGEVGKLISVFYRSGDKMTKVGLYPSKADLDFGALPSVFKKQLTPSQRSEIGRAIGLRAHGIGVGSFIYLRRIFEQLVSEAHDAAQQDEGWDEEAYQKRRMAERIKSLRGHLPSRLVKTSKMYSILSKGVHELTEEECLSYFDLVLNGIKMILAEREEESEYQALVKAIDHEASQLDSQTL